MRSFFTSESVSEGHPDKVADQISDAILDAILAQDPYGRVACETLVTTGLVIIAGEVTTTAQFDAAAIARKTIEEIGYTDSSLHFDAYSCGVLTALHPQSPDIAMGVDKDRGLHPDQGAGDQGMMFGYACNETPEYMPMPIAFSHRLMRRLSEIRKQTDLIPYLRPDAKTQVTIEYRNGKPLRVHTIVLSTQHEEFEKDWRLARKKIEEDIRKYVIPEVIPAELLDENLLLYVNPTGRFVVGGPHADTGLTGRKIIVDTYGGKGAHGGGAFSGKDPTKVDRSGAYMARYVAKNLVAAGIADEVLIQIAYAIGISKPLAIYVNTYNTAKIPLSDEEIANKLLELFDFRPAAIIDTLQLANPIYKYTAAYGHMGRTPQEIEIEVHSQASIQDAHLSSSIAIKNRRKVTLFPWEKTDKVEYLQRAFSLTKKKLQSL